MTMKSRCMGHQMALEKDILGYQPVVTFEDPPQQWYVNEDGQFDYNIASNGGQLLDSWDWIGLYHENFTSLDDYVTFCWASSCRRTGLPKTCVISDSALYAPGKFVL